MRRADRRSQLYARSDFERPVPGEGDVPATDLYRSSFRRDYGRLLHCASFRRLQGKKQLFPGHESDFFRNRLTHSLEVAQIAKAIALKINVTDPFFRKNPVDLDLVEFAALAHDLGHPPFGHNGEEALDECMENAGGFEGNAQTLRILGRLEKRVTHAGADGIPVAFAAGIDQRAGLNVTYRSLASVLKYDRPIPRRKVDRDRSRHGPVKGYYYTEAALVQRIKAHVDHPAGRAFKSVECSIMDVADDIAYSTYDLEDAFKAHFLTPVSILKSDLELVRRVCRTITDRARDKYRDLVPPEYEFGANDFYHRLLEIFGDVLEVVDDEAMREIARGNVMAAIANAVSLAAHISDKIADEGYYRTSFTSELVRLALDGIEIIPGNGHPMPIGVRLSFETFQRVEVVKNLVYQSLIMSPMLKVTEYRGKAVIREIFAALTEDDGHRLMPSDFQALYTGLSEPDEQRRVVCDFIAGMTDRYAMQFHNRLFGSVAETIYSPI
jgi:dGTPase